MTSGSSLGLRSSKPRHVAVLMVVIGVVVSYLANDASARAAKCRSLVSSPADDAPNVALLGDGSNINQLDVIGGGIVAEDSTTLVAEIKLKDLSAEIPTNGMSTNWMSKWTYGDTIYFARARIDRFSPGVAAYTVGTYDPSADRHTTTGTTEGEFIIGPSGTVQIEIPIQLVANPTRGTRLTNVFAITYLGQGIPGAGTLNEIDRGPKDAESYGGDYVMGSCRRR